MTARPLVRRMCLFAVPGLLVAVGAKPLADGRPGVVTAARNSAAANPAAGGGASAGQAPRTATGYHHLGVSTDGDWAGVVGRLTVRNPGVRPGTRDFVAVRFMAKRALAGRMSWLEAGWAEIGWSGDGRQRIYTYDTTENTWTFYDQFPLRSGDHVWIYLRSAGQAAWQAWLWWRGSWRLLAAPRLPIGVVAQLEQYVEVHVDPARDGAIPVPPVRVDHVAVQARPGGPVEPWLAPGTHSTSGDAAGAYCAQWLARFDTWSAGSCPRHR